MAWFNAEDLANCGSRDCRIVSKATGGVKEQDHYFMVSTIKSGSDTRLRFRLKTGTTATTLIATTNITENRWMHVAAVYVGTTMILYQGGTEVGTHAKTGTIATDPTVPVWIGGNPLRRHPPTLGWSDRRRPHL